LQNREAELGPQPRADLGDRIIDFGQPEVEPMMNECWPAGS
jgi:hypothetical protein